MTLTAFNVLAFAAIGIAVVLLLLVLFEPGLAYSIRGPLPPSESREFLNLAAALVDVPVMGASRVAVLAGGALFYEEELRAIAAARRSVHLEAYVFHPSRIAQRFIEALAERARSGVRVRLVIDAIGSINLTERWLAPLRAAGGEVHWYQPVRWHTLKRFNNRTHRELLVVDGAVAFVGGAGVGAWWTGEKRSGLPWRDTMVRVEGPLAAGLQSSFAENWLESSGEVIADAGDFPPFRTVVLSAQAGETRGLVVTSAPSAGKATRARILFQLLLAAARKSIHIQSPYFLPDRSVVRELARAVERGAEVLVLVPGRHNNHPLARLASRRRYGALFDAGVRIFEYQPAMMHAKVLLVDGVWSVIGSTNFDHRSFGLNDEVNLAVQDPELCAELERQFAADLQACEEASREQWERRSLGERVLAGLGRVLERQQ